MIDSMRIGTLPSCSGLGSKLEDWNGMGTAWTYAKERCSPCARSIRSAEQREDAGLIWDSVLREGKSMGISARLEIRGKHPQGVGIAHTVPFDDPDKKKRTAAG